MQSFSSHKNVMISWLILLFWLGVVIFVSSYHEVWRDEMRALSIVRATPHLWQLPAALHNEGHPLLWYVLLWVGYVPTKSTMILKITSISIAFLSVVIFWFHSPFHKWFKAFFIFSFLPFYEYAIISRNYGISMLLLFVFASYYSKQNRNPIILGLVLFLLANTNVHSAIFVGLLSLFIICDNIFGQPNFSSELYPSNNRLWIIWPLLLGIAGILLCLWTVIPDSSTIVLQTSSLTVTRIIESIKLAIVFPGAQFHELLAGLPLIVRSLYIIVFAIGLIIRPCAAILVFAGALIISVFFDAAYSGALRHQGVYFIYVITIYWIVQSSLNLEPQCNSKKRVRLFRLTIYGAIPLLLIIHIFGSYKYIYRDFTQQISSSKEFGSFLKNHENLSGAIIIGEPDLRIESLPYYADNLIYLPREAVFRNFVRLTTDNRKILTLRELLDDAIFLKQSRNQPVLIVLGHFDLDMQKPPYRRIDNYNKEFIWTEADLKQFYSLTEKVAEYKTSVKNERYEVYRLLDSGAIDQKEI